MRPAWRLSISSLSVRRSRTALLIATVALSSALIAAVACAMASVHRGVRDRVEATVGAADLRLSRVGRDLFPESTIDRVRSWPETRLAVPRLAGAIAFKKPRREGAPGADANETISSAGEAVSTIGHGVEPSLEYQLRNPVLVAGRLLQNDDEVVLDEPAAKALGASLGDTLQVQRFGEPLSLRLVGVVKPPPLGTLSVPESFVTLHRMQEINQTPGRVGEIEITIADPKQAEKVAEARSHEFEKGLVLRAGSKILSGLNKNVESSQIGMTIASVLSFLAASFIITTGLTTNVSERQRELAMVRCIGGTKAQMAESQLAIGLIIGTLGALVGLPLGVLGAYLLVKAFPDRLPGGFALNQWGLLIALIGSVGSGLIGAMYPAIKASRTSPLEALVVRAKKPTARGLVLCGVAGLTLAAVHVMVLWKGGSLFTNDGSVADKVFWGDVFVGAPALFAGYFLMAVPVTVLCARVVGPPINRLLGLPGRRGGVMVRTVLATPYRFGFTAGAMMMGLALLVGIWTNGRAIMRDWLGSLEFPDAFVAGISLSERTRDRIAALPFVTNTAAVSIQALKTDAFGIKAFDHATTSFIGFDPAPFFAMTKLTWIEGDPVEALSKLEKGGAIIVAKEFKVTRGIKVGDTLNLEWNGKPYPFEVVGVVNSPGLDIASKFFSIGEDYLDQSVNAVFGSRADLKRIFGNTGIQLIQVGIRPDFDDKEAMKQIRRLAGFEVVTAGSGREIKKEITGFLSGTLLIFSLVAIAAMLVACFGVANLIVASIQARTFEFGVLRAMGAQRSVLTRLVLGEALIVALGACVMGTLMGLQISWGGQRMYELILGILLKLRLPVVPTALGWLTVIAITLGAAYPAIWALSRREPRELLGAVKG